MALTITSISPNVVPSDGGYKLTLTGTFDLETPYLVSIGFQAIGSSSEVVPAYQPSGNGETVLANTATTMEVYSPVLELEEGKITSVYIEEAASPATNASLDSKLSVVPPDFKTLSFQMRTLFPPKYRLGPRDLTSMSRVNEPKNLILYSEDFSTNWSLVNITITGGKPDPFGGSNATAMNEVGSNVFHVISQGFGPETLYETELDQTLAVSCYVSPGTGARDWCFVVVSFGAANPGAEFWVNVVTGSVGTIVVGDFPYLVFTRSVGNGWYRITMVARSPSQTTEGLLVGLGVSAEDGDSTYIGTVADALRFTAFQIDEWSVERKYLPTTDTPVT
jgi:hypothetical protein